MKEMKAMKAAKAAEAPKNDDEGDEYYHLWTPATEEARAYMRARGWELMQD